MAYVPSQQRYCWSGLKKAFDLYKLAPNVLNATSYWSKPGNYWCSTTFRQACSSRLGLSNNKYFTANTECCTAKHPKLNLYSPGCGLGIHESSWSWESSHESMSTSGLRLLSPLSRMTPRSVGKRNPSRNTTAMPFLLTNQHYKGTEEVQ